VNKIRIEGASGSTQGRDHAIPASSFRFTSRAVNIAWSSSAVHSTPFPIDRFSFKFWVSFWRLDTRAMTATASASVQVCGESRPTRR
jgi:hypothetical protein